MFNPLLEDPTDLSDQDLNQKISEINKKISFALKSNNTNMYNQLLLVHESYKQEQSERHRKKMEELLKNKGADFDDILDIN